MFFLITINVFQAFSLMLILIKFTCHLHQCCKNGIAEYLL